MKPTAVTSIALAIIVLTVAATALAWTYQGVKLEPVHFMNGAGVGCMLALVWVLIAAVVNLFRPRRR